jgi:ribosomal protein S18 acetylase RimI-like enzyme
MLTIRPAQPDDLDLCAAISPTYATRSAWQLTVSGDAGRDGPLDLRLQQARLPRALTLTLPSAAAPLAETWAQAAAIFVAEDAGQVCGYMVLGALNEQRQALLARLLVDEARRGKGCGTALVREARAWGQQAGMVRLLAHAPLRNTSGVSFYQRRGFRICGLSEHFYPSREDALLLERWL